MRHVIKALECEIGEPLFEVRKNRLEPTEAAHKLYQLSDGAVAAFETVERAFAPAAPEEARTVRCATAYSSMESLGQAGQLFVIGNIPALDQPDVRYEFCYGTDEEIKEGIIGGSLDCGFFIGVGQRDPRLDYVEKRSGRLHLLVPANSSLAGRAEVGIDDLRGLPFSSQGAAFEVPTFLANACAQQGFALDVVSESLEIRPPLAGGIHRLLVHLLLFRCAARIVRGDGCCSLRRRGAALDGVFRDAQRGVGRRGPSALCGGAAS